MVLLMGEYLHSVWWWFGMILAAVSLVLIVRDEVKKRRIRRGEKELESQKNEIDDIKRKKNLP